MKAFDELRPEDLVSSSANGSGAGYVPLKLASSGKLGLPAVVYVRDYSYSDALKLASMNNDNASEVVFEVLTHVIRDGETLPLQNLTYTDVLEILMTIQGTWYSPTLEYPYYIDETLPSEKKDKRENISKAPLRIRDIDVIPFPENVNIPAIVTVKSSDFEAEVDYPRFYNEVIAKKYIEMKYADSDNKYASLKKKIASGDYTSQEFSEYTKYEAEKSTDLIKAIQALQIFSVNGKKLETLEERIKAIDDFPLKAWSKVMNHLNGIKFGIDPEVTFKCTVTGKEITRRFPFRISDFLPSMESLRDAGDDVSIR